MKTFLLLISFGIITLSVGVKEAFSTDHHASATSQDAIDAKENGLATFDGFEGDYYFFTDSNNKAIQLEECDHPILSDEKFENGDYIGEKFDLNEPNLSPLSIR